MKIRYPHYYHDFSCIASRCPDSCCKEWEVDVDPEAAAYYRTLSGPLGDRLRSVLRNGEEGWASMTITDRRCPMWRNDGLCHIQAELGHDALCKTCREFPRLTHDYGDFQELGLELSCPEAARLILSSTQVHFQEAEVPGGEEPEYDKGFLSVLLDSRAQALALLANPAYGLGQALSVLLLFGYDTHMAWEFRDEVPVPLEPDIYLEAARQAKGQGSMADIFDLYRTLEILTPEWQTLLDQGPAEGPWLPEHRAMAIYLVQRYWLQAVADEDLLCRVKFIITACLTARHLNAPVHRAAQLWSKEIENAGDNVEALLTAAYQSPALTDQKLLHLLTK